jgi:Carboxypeptidase regulatory-like domain
MKVCNTVLFVGLLICAACHPGPVIDTGPKPPVGGTIAGIVSSDSKVALPTRKVTAINTETGARFETTTGVNGGYTIQVPQGRYRLEVELREGEAVAKHPEETRITRSDLDTRRDFVITLKK